MTLLWTLLLTVAGASELTDRLLRDVAYENAPWRSAPLVFLVDQDDGRSCGRLMYDVVPVLPRTHLYLNAASVRTVADLWRFSGPAVGYIGSDTEGDVESFVRKEPRGFVLVRGGDNAWGAQLAAEWLGKSIAQGELRSSRGVYRFNDLTFIFQVPEHTNLAPGLSVADLVRHEVASSTADGCTYHVVNRLRAQALLGCRLALQAAPTP